jgi:TolA-binding protein
MVDPFDDPESSEPQASSHSADEFADLTPAGDRKPGAAHVEDFGASAPVVSYPVDEEPRHPAFPIILAAGLIVALVIACTTDPQPASASAPATAAAPPAPAATPAAESAAPAPDFSADIKGLRADLEGLSTRIKELQGRVEALPAPPDLKPLQSKIDDLAKTSEATASLPKQVDALAERVGAVDKSLASLNEELTGLKSEIKKPAEAATPAPKPEDAKAESPKVADDAINPGVELFKAGKYKDANELFHKLTESYPDDARVWYYAALSNGLATNQWQAAETIRLVTKGIEREKAGSPDAAKINSAFQSLTDTTGKTWLDYYRKTAKR